MTDLETLGDPLCDANDVALRRVPTRPFEFGECRSAKAACPAVFERIRLKPRTLFDAPGRSPALELLGQRSTFLLSAAEG